MARSTDALANTSQPKETEKDDCPMPARILKMPKTESVSDDKRKKALKVHKNFKNDPVLSQLIAYGITQLAVKAAGFVTGSV